MQFLFKDIQSVQFINYMMKWFERLKLWYAFNVFILIKLHKYDDVL